MIGCASLPTIDERAAASPLAVLQAQAGLPEDWQVAPLPGREAYIPPVEEPMIDSRQALSALPPLLKAYLRVGAKFSKGAVIDRQFGTIDVFTIMQMSEIDKRYAAHFGAPNGLASGSVA